MGYIINFIHFTCFVSINFLASKSQVCMGSTSHIEVCHIHLSSPTFITPLLRFFFQIHDPTTANNQVNDVGPQYSSVIFTYDDIAMKLAQDTRDQLRHILDTKETLDSVYENKKIVTEIKNATVFYSAEEEHQLYLQKYKRGYCNHIFRFRDWPILDEKTN